VPRNWDEHYLNPADLDFTPGPLLGQVVETVAPGRALDLACGHGRNSLYLASLGWQVTAVDRSEPAIRILRDRAAGLSIDARVADLERGEFTIEPEAYDLIVDFFYLQRDLFPAIRAGVRVGGIFAGAIHLYEEGRHRCFSVASGELRKLFEDWKILYYSEALEPGRTRRSARLLARRA